MSSQIQQMHKFECALFSKLNTCLSDRDTDSGVLFLKKKLILFALEKDTEN